MDCKSTTVTLAAGEAALPRSPMPSEVPVAGEVTEATLRTIARIFAIGAARAMAAPGRGDRFEVPSDDAPAT